MLLFGTAIVLLVCVYSLTVSGNVSSTGYYSGSGTTTGGGSLNVFCEVQIETDEYNIIRAVTITRDTIGNWTTSRCGEIFK